MYTFSKLKPVRPSGLVTGFWALMMAAMVAALLGGSAPTANAVTTKPVKTPATSAVSVIPNAASGTALLTATRVGTGTTYQFTTAALHVNPLPSSSEPQSVLVGWELQSASPGPHPTWTKVDYRGPGYGLYSVAEDPDDLEGLGYIYVPLTGGQDLAPERFTNRVVAHEEQALRVVAKVTWTNRSTGQVLGSVTLTPTTRTDLACQGSTPSKCRVKPEPSSAGTYIKLLP